MKQLIALLEGSHHIKRWTLLISLLGGVAITWLALPSQAATGPEAYSSSPSTLIRVRSEPNLGAPVIHKLKSGSALSVRCVTTSGGQQWVRTRLGWVAKSLVRGLPNNAPHCTVKTTKAHPTPTTKPHPKPTKENKDEENKDLEAQVLADAEASTVQQDPEVMLVTPTSPTTFVCEVRIEADGKDANPRPCPPGSYKIYSYRNISDLKMMCDTVKDPTTIYGLVTGSEDLIKNGKHSKDGRFKEARKMMSSKIGRLGSKGTIPSLVVGVACDVVDPQPSYTSKNNFAPGMDWFREPGRLPDGVA